VTTFERIQNVICSNLGVDKSEVKPQTAFCDLCTDSLEMASLVQDLEDEFSISIDDLTHFPRVQDAVEAAEAA
jgi:acyl carrier protein